MEQSRVRRTFSELVQGERIHSGSLKGCSTEEIAKVEGHLAATSYVIPRLPFHSGAWGWQAVPRHRYLLSKSSRSSKRR